MIPAVMRLGLWVVMLLEQGGYCWLAVLPPSEVRQEEVPPSDVLYSGLSKVAVDHLGIPLYDVCCVGMSSSEVQQGQL
jgi:hypothetical protein